ncbi:MAG: hypothetical protein HW421_2256 [Ignavibacteria bacterium]|nr:hypothetical protein [Ignavibacteria bacterium]
MEKIILLIFSIIFVSSCQNSTKNNNSENLLKNPNFELNKLPSFQFWHGLIDTIVPNAPHGIAQYSVQISPAWFPQEGYAESGISGLSGTFSFQLTGWVKCLYKPGIMSIKHKTSKSTNIWTVTDSSKEWKQISVTSDTLALMPNDSVIVHLSAGSTEISSGRILFTGLSLKKNK